MIEVSSEEEAAPKLTLAKRRGQVAATTPFNLREGPLLRVELLKIAERDNAFCLMLLGPRRCLCDAFATLFLPLVSCPVHNTMLCMTLLETLFTQRYGFYVVRRFV